MGQNKPNLKGAKNEKWSFQKSIIWSPAVRGATFGRLQHAGEIPEDRAVIGPHVARLDLHGPDP